MGCGESNGRSVQSERAWIGENKAEIESDGGQGRDGGNG